MTSIIRGSDNFDSADAFDVAGARAWVNFNGTGTVAIRDSYNVSSITDNGTGQYTANFTTAMANANYCAVNQAGNGTSSNYWACGAAATPTTTAFAITTGTGSHVDLAYCMIAIFAS